MNRRPISRQIALFGLSLAILMMVNALPAPAGTPTNQAQGSKQRIRFLSISGIRENEGYIWVDGQQVDGYIWIAGEGSAIVDGGKSRFNELNRRALFPLLEVTIVGDPAGRLQACLKRAKVDQQTKEPLDLQGEGSFSSGKSEDSDRHLGVFKLTRLTHCQKGEAAALGANDDLLAEKKLLKKPRVP